MRELGHLRQHVGADVERLLAIDEGYGEILSITTRMHSSTVSVIVTPLEGWVRRDTLRETNHRTPSTGVQLCVTSNGQTLQGNNHRNTDTMRRAARYTYQAVLSGMPLKLGKVKTSERV